MTNFSSILDAPSEGGKRPPPLPAGSYNCVVQGLPEYGQSSQKQTPFVKFILTPVTALDDVDSDALSEAGGLAGKKIYATYYITEDAKWRLEAFLKHCGLDESEFSSIRQMIEATPGCSVVANMRHKPYQDGSGIFAELANTAAVD